MLGSLVRTKTAGNLLFMHGTTPPCTEKERKKSIFNNSATKVLSNLLTYLLMLLYTFDTQRYWVDSLYKNEEIYFEEKKLNKSY